MSKPVVSCSSTLLVLIHEHQFFSRKSGVVLLAIHHLLCPEQLIDQTIVSSLQAQDLLPSVVPVLITDEIALLVFLDHSRLVLDHLEDRSGRLVLFRWDFFHFLWWIFHGSFHRRNGNYGRYTCWSAAALNVRDPLNLGLASVVKGPAPDADHQRLLAWKDALQQLKVFWDNIEV